jgi:glycosyltransferase involved in cell wall biosynthesis
MRDAFREWGHQADVYALDVDADLRGDGLLYADFRAAGPGHVVILHYALPSPLTAALLAHPGRRVLLHHNITPPSFFAGYDEEMVRICSLGAREWRTLRGAVDLALGDSDFNRRELEEAGFPRTGTLPILMDFARYRERPDPVSRRLWADGRTNLLFVGRLAPNKRQDDLVRLAAYWRRFIGHDVRLLLVGKHPRNTAYFDVLQALAYEHGFTPWDVVFAGHVSHHELLAAYATAHVFVSLSEHEGFGVPLVEAMLMRVPILAYRATAVADTLGEAGVQFADKTLAVMAEAAAALARPGPAREGVLRGQDERLRRFEPSAVRARLREYVESL